MVITVKTSADRVRLELHCHSAASYDGTMDPLRLAQLCLQRGLTHVALTDHETLEGAIRARESAPDGLTVIVGQEARTTQGDLIALFVSEAIPAGLSAAETARQIRGQGGLVGLPHPFDVRRPSVGRGAARQDELARLAELVDYVEVHNGRVLDPAANARAADFARAHELPQAAVSDAHTEDEVGTVATVLDGPCDTADELLRALGAVTSLVVRERAATLDEGAFQRLTARVRRPAAGR